MSPSLGLPTLESLSILGLATNDLQAMEQILYETGPQVVARLIEAESFITETFITFIYYAPFISDYFIWVIFSF